MSDTVNLSMTDIPHLADLVQVAPDSTVSRTALTAEGGRIVLFAFDTGQELTEHTAAVPVLLQALDGSFDITADGRTVRLEPGALIHLGTRTPHAVVARVPSRLMLTMLDPRLG